MRIEGGTGLTVLAIALAALAYTILLYAPWPGPLLAPIAAGLVAGYACSSPGRALGTGALSGLLGYLLALYTTGAGIQGLALTAGIAGGPVVVLALAYHTLAPGLAGYLIWPLARRRG